MITANGSQAARQPGSKSVLRLRGTSVSTTQLLLLLHHRLVEGCMPGFPTILLLAHQRMHIRTSGVVVIRLAAGQQQLV